jgi:hypothetical protein
MDRPMATRAKPPACRDFKANAIDEPISDASP